MDLLLYHRSTTWLASDSSVLGTYSTADKRKLTLLAHAAVESAVQHHKNVLIYALTNVQQQDIIPNFIFIKQLPKEMLPRSVIPSRCNFIRCILPLAVSTLMLACWEILFLTSLWYRMQQYPFYSNLHQPHLLWPPDRQTP
mgnify:CR=1 FL=1